jgi:hypothetical protein
MITIILPSNRIMNGSAVSFGDLFADKNIAAAD